MRLSLANSWDCTAVPTEPDKPFVLKWRKFTSLVKPESFFCLERLRAWCVYCSGCGFIFVYSCPESMCVRFWLPGNKCTLQAKSKFTVSHSLINVNLCLYVCEHASTTASTWMSGQLRGIGFPLLPRGFQGLNSHTRLDSSAFAC